MQGFKLNHVSKRATADNLSQPGYWNSIKFSVMEILLLQKYL